MLHARQGIGGVAISSDALSAEFIFGGADSDLAALVAALVSAGAPICGVQELTEGLEQLYIRLSSREEL